MDPAVPDPHLDGTLRDSGTRATLRRAFGSSPWAALLLIIAGLGASWLSVYIAGGVDSLVPHLYYLPIVFAAVRFGPLAALLVALIAGWLAGPMSYVAVADAVAQSDARWLTRTAFFVFIGQCMAWLVQPTLPSLLQEIARLREEREIRSGLRAGQFVLHYEPILSMPDGRLRGFEALVRWQHPERGVLPPSAFLSMIESSRLMRDFDDYVLRRACQQAIGWPALAPSGALDECFVSVNLSADEIADAALPERVSRMLAEHLLPASRLCIEITERTLMGDAAIPHLQRLRDLGVAVAIDDFGTGYSSLVYLSRFAADILKLDRALIARMETDEAAATLAQGVGSIADAFGMQVLAEGVETRRQREIVVRMGFQMVQGHFFTETLSEVEVQDWIRGHVRSLTGPAQGCSEN